MANNLGPGVSRVLNPDGTAYSTVIWQAGKPPLDSELTFLQDLAQDFSKKIVLRGTPSGWLGNETNSSQVYTTNPAWSNWFKFGVQKTGEEQSIQWANVNGWLIPVMGTRTGTPPGSPDNTSTWNLIALDPPPANAGDGRVDFVFLEVWQARIPSNPSTLNKPVANGVYKYGNVEGGYTYITDDIKDPAIGAETTQRVQLQYRIRVVKGVLGLTTYPDGFDPTMVFGRGSTTTDSSYSFVNMRQKLGDPGLWRAGDGSSNAQTALGSVDGYVYAIPMTAVFRRNSATWAGDPSPNLNGGFNRNPTAVDRTGIKTFTATATLASSLSDSALSATLVTATGIPLPTGSAAYVRIGDEIVQYSSISGVTMTLVARAQMGTVAEAHLAGTTVTPIAGRPDGLFSDQIVETDLLDLRHIVNPNGFDYDAILKSSVDKLLKGELRASWKRTNAGPQGPFVMYQDKVVSLGGPVASPAITRLDGPDGVRTTFSDAAVPQVVTFAVKPVASTSANQPIGAPGYEQPNILGDQSTTNQFTSGDTITIPIAGFKTGLPGGDADQVCFVNQTGAVKIRLDGHYEYLDPSQYTVNPATPTSSDDLVIALTGSFAADANTTMYISVVVQYGPGRGLARRPDILHDVSWEDPSSVMLHRPSGVPAQYFPMHVAWAPLQSTLQSVVSNQVPVTAEAYADLGSKTLCLTPFRQITWPTAMGTLDGTYVNANNPFLTGTAGATGGPLLFADSTKDFTALGVVAGDIINIEGVKAGVVTVAPSGNVTRLVLDHIYALASGLSYTISHSQGLMPILDKAGAAKWTTSDPLGLFSGSQGGATATKNIYVTLPRHRVPGWGAVHVPILPEDDATFSQGINFMCQSNSGTTPAAASNWDKNYVPYLGGPTSLQSWAIFSTCLIDVLPGTVTPATYNAAFLGGGVSVAGIRKYTDTRGLGRKGLQLPPYYGIARLFSVYSATDYAANGSSFDPNTRVFTGSGATNLLRQNVSGPTFWIEIDADGDSTFILNADCIDVTKADPTYRPASFDAGNFVIEANIFGFDRGSFSNTDDFRLVLTRPATGGRAQAVSATRNDNITRITSANTIAGPHGVLPGPLKGTDEVVVTYSRTPYMGDAWGSQTTYADIPYAPGPMTSAKAWQIADPANVLVAPDSLTRPNQKALEVLASLSFQTTYGTGRMSGPTWVPPYFHNLDIGYENRIGTFPPGSAVDARPPLVNGAFVSHTGATLNTAYLGLTERLPLGSLWKDKDFTGINLGPDTVSGFRYVANEVGSVLGSLSRSSGLAQTGWALEGATIGSGTPGDVLVHVDGETANYALRTNFRTYRGGSVFMASGRSPGGEFAQELPVVTEGVSGYAKNVLNVTASLVRNVPTVVGSNEVSAGDELMLLVTTTGVRVTSTLPSGANFIGTNGSGEGYSASDLYRIPGHPLVTDNVRLNVDPSAVVLTYPIGF